MRPETRAALEQAMHDGDTDKVSVISQYIHDGWDSFWPWPGAGWLAGRYESWEKHQKYLLTVAETLVKYQ